MTKKLVSLKIDDHVLNALDACNLKRSNKKDKNIRNCAQQNTTLKIFVQNIRSINEEHKKQYVFDVMNRYKPDILALTET